MQTDCHSVWNNCLQYIQENIGEQSFNTWFAPISPVKLEDKILTIQVPSQFFYEWLEEHYVHLLRKAIDRELGKEGRLEYSIIVDPGNMDKKAVTMKFPARKNHAVVETVEPYEGPFNIKSVNVFQHDSQKHV